MSKHGRHKQTPTVTHLQNMLTQERERYEALMQERTRLHAIVEDLWTWRSDKMPFVLMRCQECKLPYELKKDSECAGLTSHGLCPKCEARMRKEFFGETGPSAVQRKHQTPTKQAMQANDSPSPQEAILSYTATVCGAVAEAASSPGGARP